MNQNFWFEAGQWGPAAGDSLALDWYDDEDPELYYWKRTPSAQQQWNILPIQFSGFENEKESHTMVIRSDVGGDNVQFSMNSEPGKSFKYPVFFARAARLSKKQLKVQPVLFMSEVDWNFVSDPNVTHEGAFGSDYDVWSRAKVSQRWKGGTYDARQEGLRWVAVWKFPGDLNYIDGYKTIYDAPLPVGYYPFFDDGWMKDPNPAIHVDAQLPAIRYSGYGPYMEVEKIRYDVKKGDSVHHLEDKYGNKVAMISSHFYIEQFWVNPPKSGKMSWRCSKHCWQTRAFMRFLATRSITPSYFTWTTLPMSALRRK